ncbi:Protein YTP1 [Cyberlindnera fabianii]|nr:Protein YTP1 [Cyberlindnera fabianii]
MDGMVMEGDDEELYPRPLITQGASKSFHWILTLFLVLLAPSVSAVLVFAERLHAAVVIQIITTAYNAIEALFLRFPDGDGVENRTSRGTAWFLLLLSGVNLFFGLVHSGSKFFNNEKQMGPAAQMSERSVRIIHRVLSVVCTLTGWVKVCLAPVAMFGFCRDAHTGQCLAHGIMGSAFVFYGCMYATVLVLPFLRERTGGQSQDFYDSLVMLLWGIVNTFTEHRWGREGWGHGDYQHTAMGIIWWCGGLLGVYLARGGRRTFVPSLLLIFTGWSMSEHVQKLQISTKVHYMFGLVLMTGGALRIVEISFLLRDERFSRNQIHSFQYLPPFCLIESGVLFMGANEEQLNLVLRLKADHSSYIMVVTGGAFLIYLWYLLLLELYMKLTGVGNIDLSDYSAVGRNISSAETPSEADFDLDREV